jgi:tRNA-2-methylthio-N6-dimethylallyladenosine synthase
MPIRNVNQIHGEKKVGKEEIMKKIFIKHNGCLNLSYDFNVVKSGLQEAGYDLVDNYQDADEIIFAGCGVRAAWVDDAIHQMNTFTGNHLDKKVTVTGCISNIETERIQQSLQSKDVSFKSFKEVIQDYTRFSFELLETNYSQTQETDLEGDNPLRQKITPAKRKAINYLDQIDRKYDLGLVEEYRKTTSGFFFYNEIEPTELITVSRSCLYNCSFCTIPKGRGQYSSVKRSVIKDKISSSLEKGIYRFILIGDEVGNYGKDLDDGSNLATLIHEVMGIDSRIKIAIRYIEPTPFYRNFETIQKYCSDDRIYLLHVPIQTGSQRLLKEMNRNHSLEKVVPYYQRLINETNTAFYCNWMIGFPGETEEDFQLTLALAKEMKIHLNTVIPFSARPGTAAFERDDKIASAIIEDRSNRLEAVLLQNKLDRFKALTKNVAEEERNELLNLIQLGERSPLSGLVG